MDKPVRVEEFEYGVKVERYEDDIIVFSMGTKQTRHSMDVWAQKVVEETKRSNGKVRHIMDLTDGGGIITPYLRSKVNEINNAYPNVTGYMVVVLKENLLTQAIRLFLNREISRQQPGMETQISFSREDALDWLRSQNFD